MQVSVLEKLITYPVPRDTEAPWLDPDTHKVALYKDFVVKINNEVIVIPKDYISDWSSIPRIVWWLYPPNYTEAREGSVVHDYIYSHLYRYYDKKFADKALVAFMKLSGANRFTQTIFYRAVRMGGKGGWYHMRNPDAHPHWHEQHELITVSKPDYDIYTGPSAIV